MRGAGTYPQMSSSDGTRRAGSPPDAAPTSDVDNGPGPPMCGRYSASALFDRAVELTGPQEHRGEQIVGDPVGHFGQHVGGGRSHQDEVGLPGQGDVARVGDELAHLLVDVRRDDDRLVPLAGDFQCGNERGERLPGDWYQVLTMDGSKGYVFSYTMRLFDERTGETPIAEKPQTDPAALNTFFSASWRPAWYSSMAAEERIDLDYFSLGYGLFGDAKERLAGI